MKQIKDKYILLTKERGEKIKIKNLKNNKKKIL